MSPREPKSPTDFVRAGTFPLDPFVIHDQDGNPEDGLERLVEVLGVAEFTQEQREHLIEASQRYLLLKNVLRTAPMLTEAKRQIKALMERTGEAAHVLEGMMRIVGDLTGCSKDLLHTTEILRRDDFDRADGDEFDWAEELAEHVAGCQRLVADGKAVPIVPRLPDRFDDAVKVFREGLRQADRIIDVCRSALEIFPKSI
jgi:hypothetical protein